jgi:transcriptional regulator with XRE-family HTH domain
MCPDDLGEFIRQRRESVSPAEVGLPIGARRRTPGLRRAELATLAGISVDYLVRLEQGRDRRPSAQVLAAIADALRLGEEDRAHLRMLSSLINGTELCPSLNPPAHTVRPTVQLLLDRLEPAPAFVVNALGDVLAWTSGFEGLARPLGLLDGSPPNLVRFTFEDPRARDVFPDWATLADELVAHLHTVIRPNDPVAGALIGDLLHDAAFAGRWSARLVAVRRAGMRRVAHPAVGELRLSFETMQLADADDQRLVVYLPGDEATATALDLLAGRHPGALRAVSAS